MQISAIHQGPSWDTVYSNLEHFWSYGGKIVIISRHFLNGIARTAAMEAVAGANFLKKVIVLTPWLKLFALVSVPFSLVDVNKIGQKILKQWQIDDKEGAALNSLSLSIIATDAVDSITTFINAALTIAGSTPIDFYFPFGYVMNGFGTISRSIKLAKSITLYGEINHKLLHNAKFKDRKVVKKFVKETLGVDKINQLAKSKVPGDPLSESAINQLKAKMKERVLRTAPSSAVEEFEKIYAQVQNKAADSDHAKVILNGLKKIKALIGQQITINLFGISANLFGLVSLAIFSVGAAAIGFPLALPYLLLALSFCIRLLNVAYQDYIKTINSRSLT